MANDEDGADAPDDATVDERIVGLLETAERLRLTATTVAERLDLPRGRVRTRLQALADEDHLVRRDEGTTARWAVPDRVGETADETGDAEASGAEGRPRVDAEDADFGAEDAQTETDAPEGMVGGEEGMPADRGDPDEGAASDAEDEEPDGESDNRSDERTDGGPSIGATGVTPNSDLDLESEPGSDPTPNPDPRERSGSGGSESGLPGFGTDNTRTATLAVVAFVAFVAFVLGFAALRALRGRSRFRS